jgi:hypothetical protein
MDHKTTVEGSDAHARKEQVGIDIFSGCDDEVIFLLEMRKNICSYAKVIDTYAPCIVTSGRWNNDVNMQINCNTSDRKVWSQKILSVSDEAFLLLCLLNYAKRWYAESAREARKVRMTMLSSLTINFIYGSTHSLHLPPSYIKQRRGQEWTDADEAKMPVRTIQEL